MKKIGLGIGGVLCLALALIVHNFYIDYEAGELSNEEFIFSWPSSVQVSEKVRAELLRQSADELARNAESAKYRELSDPIEKQANEQCNYRDLGKAYRCLSDHIAPGHLERTDTAKKVGEAVFQKAEKDFVGKFVSTPVWSGMVPSKFIVGSSVSTKSRAEASSTALWCGIILPVGLLVAGLWLLLHVVSDLRRKSTHTKTSSSSPASSESYKAPAPEPLPPKAESALVSMLRSHFGPDFPVYDGAGTEADPLVISRKIDYVSVEYVVAEHVMKSQGEEFIMDKQGLRHSAGKAIDELVYRVKPAGFEDWTGRRRFFFDITKGFNELGR